MIKMFVTVFGGILDADSDWVLLIWKILLNTYDFC